MPIVLMIIGVIIELGKWLSANLFPVQRGVVDTTIENLLFEGGLYFALPCGLLSLVMARYGRSKGQMNRWLARAGIALGAVGLLFGILTWAYFNLMSAFVF